MKRWERVRKNKSSLLRPVFAPAVQSQVRSQEDDPGMRPTGMLSHSEQSQPGGFHPSSIHGTLGWT